MADRPLETIFVGTPTSNVVREFDDWIIPQVTRAEGAVILYSKEQPTELLEEGKALGLDDFQQTAETVGSKKGMGTRAFKAVIAAHGEYEPPFSFCSRLSGSPEGHGICSSFGYVGIKLCDFYALTQGLYDSFQPLSMAEARRLYGPKGRQLVEALLFDISG